MKIAVYGLLIILCFVPSALLMRSGYIEAWVYPAIALVQNLLSTGYLDLSKVQNPGYPTILAVLCEISGLSPINMLFLPIGALLFSLMYFCLARKIFENSVLASVFAIYSTWDISLMGGYNATFYALTHPMYLLFILLTLQLRESKKIKTLYCLCLLFIGSFLTHPEASIWMIVALIALDLALLVGAKQKGNGRANIKMGHKIAFSFIVIFLSFNSFFYDVWIKRLERFYLSEPLSLLLTSRLKPGSWTTEKYLTSSYDPLLSWLRISQYAVILFPIIFAILLGARKVATNKKFELGKKETYSYLWLTLLPTAFIDVVAYSVAGWISVKYIGLVFPVLTVASLHHLKSRKWFKMAVLLGLMTLVFSSATLYIDSLNKGLTTYSDIEVSTNWFFKNSIQGKILLTDLSTYGKFLMRATISKASFVPRFYDSFVYEELFGANCSFVNESGFSENKFDYLVVDYKGSNRPTQSIGNKYYEPLFFHLHELDNKVTLERIYDDNIAWIFNRDH